MFPHLSIVVQPLTYVGWRKTPGLVPEQSCDGITTPTQTLAFSLFTEVVEGTQTDFVLRPSVSNGA